MPKRGTARLGAAGIAAALFSAVLAGCSMLGGGDAKPETTATASAAPPAATEGASASTARVTPVADSGQIDIRRYLGPNYCPELRILNGAELMRRYEKGHDDDAKFIIWQASLGKTARECLYDAQGGLTLRVGLSGRVIAGPKGGAGAVTVPLKVAVVKFRESTLATEIYPIDASIPDAGATSFTQVKEITVPSPGQDHDYIIYVGFDVGKWDLMKGELEPVIAAAPPPPPPVDVPPPVKRKQPQQPNVLPVPDSGFVLPQ